MTDPLIPKSPNNKLDYITEEDNGTGFGFKKPNKQDFRTGSLNPGAANGYITSGMKLIESSDQPKASQRTMSLATRPDTDPMELVERAIKLCKQPIKLSWTNVFYEVDVPTTDADREANPAIGKTKRQAIVKSVSGFAPPGQASFIMGASGAGKTSLLNILADRIYVKGNIKLSGNILFNDVVPVNKDMFSRYGGYVQQDDVLFSHFTVREALQFAARLKLKISDEEQDRLVEKIIHDLGLTIQANSQIGDVRRKILSGGERKRASIGVELVSDPSIILLDEPTSGLDSFKAQSICALLNNLARTKGKTILATIHSPSSEAFFYFDKLILMMDGYIVYQGDAKQSVQHFKMIGRPVPRFANPADFFMKVLSCRYPKTPEDEKNIEELTRNYRTLLQSSVNAEQKLIKLPAPPGWDDGQFDRMAGIGIQLKWLFHRSWILAKREPRLSRAKILQTVVVALFMCSVFVHLGQPGKLDQPGSLGYSYVQSLAGAIYFTTVLQMFLNFLPTVIVFQGEKPIYTRERDSGLYHVWVYATTKLLAEMPIMLFVPLLLNVLLYWTVGYEDRISRFVMMYLVLLMMVQAAAALGYFLSSIFNHETTAVAFSPIINLPLNLLGGYMISLKGIFEKTPQKYIAWLSYISPVRWGFQGMMLTEFRPYASGDYIPQNYFANNQTANATQFQYNAWKALNNYNFCVNCSIFEPANSCNNSGCLPNTPAAGQSFNQYKHYWHAIYYLAGIFIFFRVMTIVSLMIQDMQTERKGDTRNEGVARKGTAANAATN